MASAGLARTLEARRSAAPASSAHLVQDFQRLRLQLYASILFVDSASICTAFLLADLIRHGRLAGYGISTFLVLFPAYLAVAVNGDVWSIVSLQRPRHSAASAVRALLLAIAIATLFLFSMKVGADFSRLVFGIGSCIALTLLAVARILAGQAIGRRYGWKFRREVLIVDGIAATPSDGEIIVDAAREGLRPA